MAPFTPIVNRRSVEELLAPVWRSVARSITRLVAALDDDPSELAEPASATDATESVLGKAIVAATV